MSSFTEKLRYGRKDFSPPIKKLLNVIGNEIIRKIVVVRHPLPSLLNTATYLVTRVLFDTLFHLYLVVYLDSKIVIIEKNEVVNITTKLRIDKNDDSLTIRNVPNITFNHFINNAIQRMGPRFWVYSANDNNCQIFCMNLLLGSGINSIEAKHFILQDTKSIFANRPILRKIINTTTDVAGRADVLLNGGNI